MPENQDQEKESDTRLAISTDTNKLDTEFQKFMTDISPLQLVFYRAFCGWRIVTYSNQGKQLGVKVETTFSEIKTSKYRKLNEEGAEAILAECEPMLLAIASTSKISETQAYKLINGKIDDLIDTLSLSYAQGNPYELKLGQLSSITSTLTEFIMYVKKAEKGFTLQQLAQSFITSVIQKNAKEGDGTNRGNLIDKIQQGLGKTNS